MRANYETVKGEKELWRGRQWAVTTYRIQVLGDWGYYFIELVRLEEGNWLAHMASKNVDIKDVIQAFFVACVYRRVKIENIGAVIQKARDRKAEGIRDTRRIKAEARSMGYAKGEIYLMERGSDSHFHPVAKRKVEA